MGMPGRLHGKKGPPGKPGLDGKHVMKLRTLLTRIEDEIVSIEEEGVRNDIKKRVSQARASLQVKLHFLSEWQLSILNNKIENDWSLLVSDNVKGNFTKFLQLLDKLNDFLVKRRSFSAKSSRFLAKRKAALKNRKSRRR